MSALSTAHPVERDFLELQAYGNREVRGARYAEALKDENRDFNRFFDIIPFDLNIPKFANGALTYYNASVISDGLAIAAQTPGVFDLATFYAMVQETAISTIVSLDPPENEVGIGDYWREVKPMIRKHLHGCSIKKRELTIRGHLITHFHLSNDVVDLDQMAEVMIDLIKRVDKVGGKLLVHCQTGSGMTGVFLACWSAYKNNNPDLLSIAKLHRSNNKGRMSMITSLTQYKLAARVVEKLLPPPPEKGKAKIGWLSRI